jgi:crossover junction endodeoxyribonuclease RusA
MRCLTLPWPPSVNHYWRTWKGRTLLSKEGRAYKTAAALVAKSSGLKPSEKLVAVWLTFYRPRRIGDLDNRLKPVLDSLNGTAWVDDSQVVELHAFRFDDKESPRVEVEIFYGEVKR